MKDPQIGSLYAGALQEIVFEPRSQLKPDEVLSQLADVESLLAQSRELRSVLNSPAVSAAHKKKVMAKLASELGVSHILQNFLFVLIDHKRIARLADIRESLESKMDEHRGVIRADIVSAAPIEEPQQRALEAKLMELAGKRVRLHLTVDTALIGGATARLGSTLFDGSVRGRLESIRRKLTSEAAEYKVRI